MNDETKLAVAVEFIKRLVNPDVYGLTIRDEVRIEAVRTLKLITQDDK